VGFADAIRKCFNNYATFSGRARRSEYWWFALFAVIVGVVLEGLLAATKSPIFGILFAVFWLAIIIPTLAVTVRRLHDTGRSGWWYFIILVPFIGGLVLFVFTLMDSQPQQNQFGPSPKGQPALG